MAKSDVTEKDVDGVLTPAITVKIGDNEEILTAQELSLKIASDPSNMAVYVQAITDIASATKKHLKAEAQRKDAEKARKELEEKQNEVVKPILEKLSSVADVLGLNACLPEKQELVFSLVNGCMDISIELFPKGSQELEKFNELITGKKLAFVWDDEISNFKAQVKDTSRKASSSFDSGLYQIKPEFVPEGQDGFFYVKANGQTHIHVQNQDGKWERIDATSFLLLHTVNHSITEKKNPWNALKDGKWDKDVDARPFSFPSQTLQGICTLSDGDYTPSDDEMA